MVKDGCLVQVTGQSLLGRFGKDAREPPRPYCNGTWCISSPATRTIARIARRGWIEAHRHLGGALRSERADRLCRTNPAKVLSGDPLDAQQPRKWYRFWDLAPI